MSTYHIDLVQAVKTKLETIDALKAVYAYSPSEFAGYPYAIVLNQGFDNIEISSTFIRRIHHVGVLLIQEVSDVGFDNEKAARVFNELLDEVVTAFDDDITLGGVALLIKPLRSEPPVFLDVPTKALMVRLMLDVDVEIYRPC